MIEESIPMIHPARLSQGAPQIEHTLRKGGLSGIHMGEKPDRQLAFFCLCHA